MKARHRLLSTFRPAGSRHYNRSRLAEDLLAGLVTAALSIPQGMAYATLAGLPPEVGLYASIVPAIIYACFGSSTMLSIGPVSVTALLVVDALGDSAPGQNYLPDALLLAAMSGVVLLMMSALRLGVLVNFFSRPVLNGFTAGAAVLIILSQIKNLTGLDLPSTAAAPAIVVGLLRQLGELHGLTVLMSLSAMLALWLLGKPLCKGLCKLGLSESRSKLISRMGPLVVTAAMTALVWLLELQQRGVEIIREVPAGLPAPTLEFLNLARVPELLPTAVLIAIVGYIGSISVAKVLAYRRREKVESNRELFAQGLANLTAAVSMSMPVAGSFSRSVVNYSAGAQTQVSGIAAALLIAFAALFLTPLFYYLPRAALAAVIVVSVLPLLDWRDLLRSYRYDRSDGIAMTLTFAGVLILGIAEGLVLGLAFALAAFVWRSSRPNLTVVGRLPGSEHYRNVERFDVETWPRLLLLRIDRSLFFGNTAYVEDAIAKAAVARPELQHLVIICSAVNAIDHSGVETLGQLSRNLKEAGIDVHLAEVKGPVMDRLRRSDLLEQLSGQVFLSTQAAVEYLLAPSRA